MQRYLTGGPLGCLSEGRMIQVCHLVTSGTLSDRVLGRVADDS